MKHEIFKSFFLWKILFKPACPAPAATTAISTDILAGSYGALRGTVRLLPGQDLTAPTHEAWAADI